MDKIQVNKISNDAKKSMVTRIITSIVLALVAIPMILLGGWWFLVFVAIALVFIIHEFTNAPAHKSYGPALHVFLYVMTFSFVFWIMIKNNMENVKMDNFLDKWTFEGAFSYMVKVGQDKILSARISVSTIGVVVTAFVLFFISIMNKNFHIDDVTYLFTMSVFIGIAVQSLLFLRYFPKAAFDHAVGGGADYTYNTFSTSLLLFYVIIGAFVTDVGAYFTGMLFGKKKMNERISPKKTWEGFIGGVVLSFAVSFSFAILCDHFKRPILPSLTLKNWYWILIISLVMPIIANLGDFIFSALKRHFEIKDYGTILRGHGGVLDRVDSLLCTALFVAIFVIFLSNGWNFLI